MCEVVKHPDGLPVYPVGEWTKSKLFFLCQYLAQTTQAMVGNPHFRSINYLDLFCGPGICEEERTGKRYPGSPMLAAGCTKPFDHLFLVEQDGNLRQAAVQRIQTYRPAVNLLYWQGDANTLAPQVASALPDRSLTVAFVDPFSLDVRFETIRVLAERRPLDLIILFADRMDLERNVEAYYYPQRGSKLDQFLGEKSDWRTQWDRLANRDEGRVRQLFAEIYLKQLREIGYKFSRTRPIESERGPLYRLVYASKSELGLKFWDIAEHEDLGGDRGLWSVT
jgi:three-Cys-motif partner protein